MPRPSTGGSRPSPGGAASGARPSPGNLPNLGGGSPSTRPAPGTGSRPNIGSGGAGSAARPGFVPKPGGSSGAGGPSTGVGRPSTLPGNLPNVGSGNAAGRPSIRPNLPGGTTPGGTPGTRPALPNQPDLSNRPAIRPGTRPNIDITNRPSINRPNIDINNRPNINSPSIGNRPGIGNDTNINIGNSLVNRPGVRPLPGDIGGGINNPNRPWYENRPTRPGYETRPGLGIGSGNNNTIGSNNNIFAPNINNNIYAPGAGWAGRPWMAPSYAMHYGWHHGYWNYWPPTAYTPLAVFGTGVATGWLLSRPGYVYTNPYCCATPVTNTTTVIYDYSQPIPVAEPPSPAEVNVTVNTPVTTNEAPNAPPPGEQPSSATPPKPDPKTEAAMKLFDEARAAFKQGNYDVASAKVDEAIQQLPGDPVLHEFRGLVLFAQGKYAEAAGTVYAVLAVGPGWDWETLKTLYPNTETYTAQLHKLEDYCGANPNAADARFVLAYHYLTLGYVDEAKAELEVVVKLQPQDELSTQLVKLLSGEAPATDAAPASQPS